MAASKPIVNEVIAPVLASKVVPVWVKPSSAPQVVLQRKQILPARQMTLPQLSILLPGKMAKQAPISGAPVSGAVPASKWDKIAAAVGGK